MPQTPPEQGSEPMSPQGRKRARSAGLLLGLEALALAAFAVWVIVDGIGSPDAGRAVGEGVTLLVLAALGALMTRSLMSGNGFARTPALIWQVIVLLAGFFLAQSDQPLLGGIIAIAGLGGIVLTALVPHAEL